MNTKNIVGIVIVVLVIIVGGVLISRSGSNTVSTTTTTPTTSAPSETINPNTTGTTTTTTGGTTGTTSGPASYSLAVVAQHNSRTSCWTAINGKVYDVTTWINQHPGGQQAILSLCGTDGSAAFNGQHGGQARPAAELASFIIGTEAQ